MTQDQALELFSTLLQVTMFIAGPILLASLIGGIFVGIVQAATQVNEASISFVVKVTIVLGVLLAIGPALASRVVGYTRGNLQALEHVVR